MKYPLPLSGYCVHDGCKKECERDGWVYCNI
jgi:hypothetical protein